MATTAQRGIRPYDWQDLDTDEPAGTALVRDEVVQSALHLADSAGQVRGSWSGINSALLTGDYHEPLPDGTILVASAGVDSWYELERIPLAPKVHADGRGYRIRVQFGGASSAGHRVDFAVSVVPRRAPFAFGADGSALWPLKRVSNITSTTVVALPLDDGTTWLDVSPALIADAGEAEGAWSTRTDIGGAPASVPLPSLVVLILGQTWNAGSRPRLHAYSVAEYVGP